MASGTGRNIGTDEAVVYVHTEVLQSIEDDIPSSTSTSSSTVHTAHNKFPLLLFPRDCL